MSRRAAVIILVFMVLVSITSLVWADNVRPAYLGIENSKPDKFKITWKNPITNGAPLLAEPIFPDGFKMASPRASIKTPDAIIDKWVVSSEGSSLRGKEITISGLSATTSEVLLRIQFADGSIFRTVIRPNAPTVTIPSEGKRSLLGPMVHRLFQKIDLNRLYILLLLVVALGALPSSRKRGAVLCSIALIAGSFSGYYIGNSPAEKYFTVRAVPQEEKISRVLQGLLLNVYRSFSYIQEEAVYDQMSKSVSGDLLTTVYLQNRGAMQFDGEEQARTYVDRLDIRNVDSVSAIAGGGFSVVASWDVYGAVNHWGHIHYRCNTYKAKLTLISDGEYWKIVNFDLIDETRIM